MIKKTLKRIRVNRQLKLSILLIVSLLLYVVGLTSVLILILPLVLTMGLRFPASIKSIISRYIVSFVFLYSIIQIAATIQFFLFPHSEFVTLAIIITAITLIVMNVFPSEDSNRGRYLADEDDKRAFLAAAIFAVPILIAVIIKSGAFLASIGGVQGIDGINHFATITGISVEQHFSYMINSYYPHGFHIATAFIQNGLGIVQGDLSWLMAAKLYFAQYAINGGVMLYVLYYFAVSLYSSLTQKSASRTLKTGMALSIGMTITALYFTTFVHHGFLNYFYVCTAIVVGLLYLFDGIDNSLVKSYKAKKRLNAVSLFLFAALGTSMSWPLWTPALLIIAFLAASYKFKFTTKNFISREVIILFFILILHFIPIYLQIKYSGGDPSQGINLTGGLRVLHALALLSGVVLLTIVLVQKVFSEQARYLIQCIFIPLLLMIFILFCAQDFQFGEARYYTIKSSLLIEILLIVLFTAVLAARSAELIGKSRWSGIVTLPLLVSMTVTLLVGVNQDPLQDARQVLGFVSSEPKPANFENDVAKLSKLGEEGSIKGTNAISMHISDSGKLYTNMQIFYWVEVMEYEGGGQKNNLVDCNEKIYANLFAQNLSNQEQQKLINMIRNCAMEHKDSNEVYYIVTDDHSKAHINELFGDAATIL